MRLKQESLNDVFGGLAASLVALPSALAFGVVIYSSLGPDQASAGAVAGVLGAAVIGITAPLFGGAERLVSAPCAPAAAVMAGLGLQLAAAHPGDPARLTLLLALTALLSGGLQLLYGSLGAGRLIKYIPYPVVTGYLSGVAILIFLGQVPKFLGWPAGTHFWAGLAALEIWRWPAACVGLCAAAAMVLAPRVTRKVPGPIVGLVGGVLAYWGLSLALPELRELAGNPYVVGPLAGGSSSLSELFSRWAAVVRLGPADLHAIVVPALTLSVLLSMDTLKTCVVVDALTRSRHDSNRVLLGQGAANALSALAGGVPGAGTMGATMINVQSGGRTRLSGILAGVFSLTVYLLLGRLLAWVPIAALAGILIVVAWRMFDRKSFSLLRQKSTTFDFVVMASVVVAAVAVDLMAAAGVGLALSILLFIRDQIRGSVIRRKVLGNQVFSKHRRLPAEMRVLEKEGAATVVCELQGSLFFGTTDQLFTELESDLTARKYVILDMRRVQSLDFTAAHMLEQIESMLASRGGKLLLSNMPSALPSGQDLKAYFDEVGLVHKDRGAGVFDQLDDALAWTEERLLEEARVDRGSDQAALGLSEIDLFREMEPELMKALAETVEERSCKAGEAVFRQGELGDHLYLVRRGRVRIMLPLGASRSHHVATFGRGDFFGDMAFVDRGVRSADAVATADSDLYVLSRARFNQTVRLHEVLGIRIFARLAQVQALRLRQADKELSILQDS